MKFLICLVFISMASAGKMPLMYQVADTQTSAPSAGYETPPPESYEQETAAPESYGQRQERRCTPYFDNVQKQHCEDYTERTCTTTQKESCSDVGDQNCRAVVSSKQVRKCFNVTEQRCTLKEDVKFDTIQVPVVVQKCQRSNDRVCDTVYDTSSSLKDSSECINIENPYCRNVEKTLFDRTCRTTTQFDCDTSYPEPTYPQTDKYGSAGGNSGMGGDSSYASTTNSYGQPQTNCRRTQDKKCYKTPRTVTVQQCSRRTERVCESVKEASPFVTARQSCRNEEKKVCDLEERSQPKQVKKYVYSKQCIAVPRKVCENADQKSLVPSCVGTTRKQCTYTPVEQCHDTPKKHCFMVNQKVKREKCEMVNVGGYDAGEASEY